MKTNKIVRIFVLRIPLGDPNIRFISQGKLDGLLKTLVQAKPWFILCIKVKPKFIDLIQNDRRQFNVLLCAVKLAWVKVAHNLCCRGESSEAGCEFDSRLS